MNEPDSFMHKMFIVIKTMSYIHYALGSVYCVMHRVFNDTEQHSSEFTVSCIECFYKLVSVMHRVFIMHWAVLNA